MTDIRPLVSRRGVIKAMITRFKTYFESIDHDRTGILPLQLRLAKVKDYWSQFDTVQAQIEALDPTADQMDEREAFEKSYFDVIAAVQSFIDVQLVHPPRQHTTFNNCNIEEWFGFKDIFQTLIIDNKSINDIQRFQYLRSSLKGEATKLIQAVELSAANFQVAWKLLESRYHNVRAIVNKHVSSLFNLSNVEKESSQALRALFDTSQTHIRALQALEQPTEHWDTLLIHLVTSKFDNNTRREWESVKPEEKLPTWDELTSFLSQRCQVLEAIESNKTRVSKPNYMHATKPFTKQSSGTCLMANEQQCVLCSKPHPLYRCEQLLSLAIPDRIAKCKQLNLCLNCLRSNNHSIKNCQLSGCRKCKKKHNTLLHLADTDTADTKSKPEEQQGSPSFTGVCVTSEVLLSTASIQITDSKGNIHICRAVLDSASQSNFITAKLAQRLGFKRTKINSAIEGINQSSTTAKYQVNCQVNSRINAFSLKLNCSVISTITQELPTFAINKNYLNIPNNIQLADPNFSIPSSVDLLIGAEWFWHTISIGQIKLAHDQIILQKTVFGWIVACKLNSSAAVNSTPKESKCYFSCMISLDQQLEKFWELDEYVQQVKLTQEKQECENKFLNTYQRDTTGRFIVDLPLKQNEATLGDSKATAIYRFRQLERRLDSNLEMKKLYQDFMDEYLQLGHMQLVSEGETTENPVFYLPHHAVMKADSTTTKLRVVFDASAVASNGKSLNDILMVGATVQPDLITIILRFRMHAYVMTADIAKMYRLINVNSKHADLQRILWRNDPQEPIQVYKLTTVTYGTASVPFLATRCLNQLAIEEGDKFPLASAVTLTDFYMDDLMTGCDTLLTALDLQEQLLQMLARGGFQLRKWSSNHPELITRLPSALQSSYPHSVGNQAIKTLGLLWNPCTDEFYYSVSLVNNLINKRSVLSDIAHIFDPLGLIGPLITKAKIFMQRLWLLKLTWDESLPAAFHTEWQSFKQEL